MSFRKWLYRKEIEQLKEDLYLFKMRYEFDERSFAYTTELTEIRKYLESILINKAELSPSKIWDLTHFEWTKMDEEEFNSYYDVNLCPEENRYTLEELKEKFNKINEEKSLCLKFGAEIRSELLKHYESKNSTFIVRNFANCNGESCCFGITEGTTYPPDTKTLEENLIKWDSMIRSIECCLLKFGCSQEEIEAV